MTTAGPLESVAGLTAQAHLSHFIHLRNKMTLLFMTLNFGRTYLLQFYVLVYSANFQNDLTSVYYVEALKLPRNYL